MLQDNHWIRRTKWLTQALIVSGTLNIGFIATFAYFVLKEKHKVVAIEHQLKSSNTLPQATNSELIRAYSLLPYQELILRLENKDLIEEGLTKRDLAIACLVAFHHFNLDKALGGIPLQKRTLPFSNQEGQELIHLSVFPGLADYQFQAILQYAKTEKWPLTSQGLFYELKRSPLAREHSLLDAFYLSPEYHAVHTLLTKTGVNISREQTLNLICEGEWQALSELTQQQRISLELSADRRRLLLIDYLQSHSPLAAKILLETDLEFVSKRFDDVQILTVLDLYPDRDPVIENFAKELLASPRTDAVRKRAAFLLFSLVAEPFPEPYNHELAIQRFLPQLMPSSVEEPSLILQVKASVPISSPMKTQKKVHTVEQGDNLWKIARRYHVSVEELMRTNHMDSEKLRPGKKLEIPEKVDRR